MQKYDESNIDNVRFFKYYKFDEQYKAKDFVNDIKNFNMSISSLSIDDEVELDKIPLTGEYSYEDLTKNYDYFIENTADIKNFRIVILGNYNGSYVSIHVIPGEERLMLSSTLKDIEISDIINKETKKL